MASLQRIPRRLPLVPEPGTGESLASWVDRIGLGLRLTRVETWHALGLLDANGTSISPPAYGVRLDADRLNELSEVTGESPEQITPLLLGSLPAAVDAEAVAGLSNTMGRSDWFFQRSSQICPRCLIKDGYWQLSWKLAMSFACVRHRTLLLSVCTTCGDRLGSHHRDIRQHTICCGPIDGNQDLTKKGTPRTRRHSNDICGASLTEMRSVRVDLQVIGCQRVINELVNATGDDVEPARARLKEIQAATVLVLYLGEPNLFQASHPAIQERFSAHVEEREAKEGKSQLGPSSYRAYSTPPTDPMLMAAVMVSAIKLTRSSSRKPFAKAFVAASRIHENYADRWEQLFKFWDAPEDLQRLMRTAFGEDRFGTGVVLDGRSNPLAKRGSHQYGKLATKHVPQMLWFDEYEKFLDAGLTGTSVERDARRFLSLMLVRILDPTLTSYDKAATALDMPESLGTIGWKAKGKIIKAGRGDEFVSMLQDLARRRCQLPLIDYRTRRADLADFLAVDEATWQTIIAASGVERAASRWVDARENAAIWVWCEITGGPYRLAPALRRDEYSGQALRTRLQTYVTYFLKNHLPKLEPALRQYTLSAIGSNGECDNKTAIRQL